MSPKTMRLIALVFGATIATTTAHAETTLNGLLANYAAADATNKLVIEAIVQSSQVSISWANTYLKSERKEAPLYCPPATLVISVPQTFDILRRAVKDEPAIGKLPFGAAMIYSLQKAFPCRAASN
jgi:hypothetical protein